MVMAKIYAESGNFFITEVTNSIFNMVKNKFSVFGSGNPQVYPEAQKTKNYQANCEWGIKEPVDNKLDDYVMVGSDIGKGVPGWCPYRFPVYYDVGNAITGGRSDIEGLAAAISNGATRR